MTVEELEERMTSLEYAEWIELYNLEAAEDRLAQRRARRGK